MIRRAAASRRRAHELLARLELPSPWDVRELTDHIATRRGRAISIESVPSHALRGKVCGAWIDCISEDVLLYDGTSPIWYSDLVICHELAHILFDHHGGTPLVSNETLATWLPDLDAEAVRRVLGRTSYDSRQEYEAEYLATLIVDHGHSSGKTRDSRTHRMFATLLPE